MRTRAHSTSRLRAAAAVIAAIALVSGCAATSPNAPANANTLTYAINGGTLSGGKMDIHSSAFQATALVMRNSFDSLVYEKADGSFVPWLATSWQISDNGLHYTFDLRGDVTFHDGEPFNAEAVKANFEHVVAPETASADAASLIGYAETGGFYAGTEVIDEFTVRVNFSQPYAPFLQAVSTAKLGFYSPATLRDNAAQLSAGGPGISVGTGPYVLTEYTPDQTRASSSPQMKTTTGRRRAAPIRARPPSTRSSSASFPNPRCARAPSRAARRRSPATSLRTQSARSATTSPSRT